MSIFLEERYCSVWKCVQKHTWYR